MQGMRPDVVIMGAGASRAEIYDYAGRLMRVLNFPPLVLPTHWDNFLLPFEAPQDEYIQAVRTFTKEVNAASPKTQVIVPKCFKNRLAQLCGLKSPVRRLTPTETYP